MEVQVRRVTTKLEQTAREYADSVITPESFSSTTYFGYQSAQLVGHRIYLFGIGGLSRVRGEFKCFIAVLDTRAKEWKWILCEGPRDPGCQVFLYNDCIYHYGIVDWRNKESRSLSEFDLAFGEWSYCNSSGTAPRNRKYFSGHLIEEKHVFLVFGGYNSISVFNDIHLLRLPQFAWMSPKVTGSIPTPRKQYGSCVYQGVFYCYGGLGLDTHEQNDLYILRFDSLNRATWSRARTNTQILRNLSNFTMAPFRNVLLILGGASDEGRHEVSMYNPSSNRCSRVSTRNSQQLSYNGHSAVSLEGGRALGLLVMGGRGPIFYQVTPAG